MSGIRPSDFGQRGLLAALYGCGGTVLVIIAMVLGGVALTLLWPAASLLYVAILYGAVGATGFRKDENGRIGLPVHTLLAPYLMCAWLNSRLWTRHRPDPDLVSDQVWLGRFPSRRALLSGRFGTVVDLCAELPGFQTSVLWRAFPTMDLVAPSIETLIAAAREIEARRRFGPVLVVCALGYGRSAAAVATWLVMTGRADNAGEAAIRIRTARPTVVLGAMVCTAIDTARLDLPDQSA